MTKLDIKFTDAAIENMKIPGPRFECEDGEGVYFCQGRECEECGGTGRKRYHVSFGPSRGEEYFDSCDTCNGEGWWLFEVEGQQAIIEAHAEDLLCLPPSAVCAGVERIHDLGCQAREHEVLVDKWLWMRREYEGRGLLDLWPTVDGKLLGFITYWEYRAKALGLEVCT